MTSVTQDVEDRKAIASLEAAEAHYVELLTAERDRDMEDQKAIAFLEAAEVHCVMKLTAERGETSERPGKMASSTVTRDPDEQDTIISTIPSDDRPFSFMKLPL